MLIVVNQGKRLENQEAFSRSFVSDLVHWDYGSLTGAWGHSLTKTSSGFPGASILHVALDSVAEISHHS